MAEGVLERLQIQWKTLRNTHLLLKHSCMCGNEDLHAFIFDRNDHVEDTLHEF